MHSAPDSFLAQRGRLLGTLVGTLNKRFAGRFELAHARARGFDAALRAVYDRRGEVIACFSWQIAGWLPRPSAALISEGAFLRAERAGDEECEAAYGLDQGLEGDRVRNAAWLAQETQRDPEFSGAELLAARVVRSPIVKALSPSNPLIGATKRSPGAAARYILGRPLLCHRTSAFGKIKRPVRVGHGPSLRGDERRLDDRHRPFIPEWQLRDH